MEYFVHPSSIVEPGALIGNGSKVWHFSHIMPSVRIGRNCILGQNVFVGENVTIGNNVKIQNNVSVYTGVEIEDDVFIGPSAVFTNVINPRSYIERKDEFITTLVKVGTSIGANATIVCGVTLGCYCIIGAGAVVTQDAPDYALFYGNPARMKGWVCQCGEKIHFNDIADEDTALCQNCGRSYAKLGNKIKYIPNEDE